MAKDLAGAFATFDDAMAGLLRAALRLVDVAHASPELWEFVERQVHARSHATQWFAPTEFDVIDDKELMHLVDGGTEFESRVLRIVDHLIEKAGRFGPMQLGQVRPSMVRTWCAQLAAEVLSDSYVYALHARLSQLYADAVHDGLVAKSPCSRRSRRASLWSSRNTSARRPC